MNAKAGATDHWQRFFPAGGGEIRLVQCAEYLNDPPAVLSATVSNSTWQNRTLDAAKHCAVGASGAIEELGFQLGLLGYPANAPAPGGGTVTVGVGKSGGIASAGSITNPGREGST